MRDSMVFYRSFYEAAKELPEENRLRFYEALFAYAMDDEDAELTGIENALYIASVPLIDSNKKRYESSLKGGRPKGGAIRENVGNNRITAISKPTVSKIKTDGYQNQKPNVYVYDYSYGDGDGDGNGNGSGSSGNTDEVIYLSDSILNYLNSKVGSSYETSTETADRISALMERGYDLNDMKRVVDKKSAEWLDDNLMAHYLRPSTLFGEKFEEYLQAPEPKQVRDQKQVQVDVESLKAERQEKSDEVELIRSRIHELNQTEQSVRENQSELADLRLQEELNQERIQFIDKRLESVT